MIDALQFESRIRSSHLVLEVSFRRTAKMPSYPTHNHRSELTTTVEKPMTNKQKVQPYTCRDITYGV